MFVNLGTFYLLDVPHVTRKTLISESDSEVSAVGCRVALENPGDPP